MSKFSFGVCFIFIAHCVYLNLRTITPAKNCVVDLCLDYPKLGSQSFVRSNLRKTLKTIGQSTLFRIGKTFCYQINTILLIAYHQINTILLIAFFCRHSLIES